MQLGLGPGIAQLIARRADQLEGLLQAVQQASRLGSGLHLATPALEQRRPQLLFQLANLVADRTVGDAQLGGGAAEVSVAGSGLEGTQGGKRRQAAHGRSIFSKRRPAC